LESTDQAMFSRIKGKRILCILFAISTLCMQVLLQGCVGSEQGAPGIDASAVSFHPTVFYSRNGKIRLLYDNRVDMLYTMEGNDIVSLYKGTVYSIAVSYTEGVVKRKEADAAIKNEFSTNGTITVSEDSSTASVSGYTFRRADISVADGSYGAVLYGSTATGFAKIYYILSPDASDSDVKHVEEIVASIAFAEYEATDTEDGVKVYLQ